MALKDWFRASNYKKFSDYFYNPITYLGVLITLFIVIIEGFLFALDLFDGGTNLYFGLITYMILPPVLFFGLFLIPVGALWKRHRVLKKAKTPLEFKSFRIDLSKATHRNAVITFFIGTSLIVLMSIIGAYKAYHFTESVAFCGVLCHQVMHPEYTAYNASPHARVKCAECHIGPGADWYVRAKISGVRQIFKAVQGTYPRPIPTPVHNLRPAAETCQHCHWPGKFYSSFDFKRAYFLTEPEEGSPWHIRMLLNVGGGEHGEGGVHAHMNAEQEIYYLADDEDRQKISWVKSIDKKGVVKIFTTDESKYRNESHPDESVRKMDCIDCHNRPTHRFTAPYRLINEAMIRREIDPEIPDIKARAMKALSDKYSSRDEAVAKIEDGLSEYYKEEYPDYYAENLAKIDQAITRVRQMAAINIFPDMNVRWDTHPDNIGHLVAPGCFRCHDGEHATADGEVITRDCQACHQIVEQGPEGMVEKNIEGMEFRHPVDIDEEWKEAGCYECHTGGE